MNKLISLLVVFLLLVSFPLVLAHGENEVDYNGHHESMMSGFYWGDGFMWFFGWLFMILTIIALILFIVWLLKQLTKENSRKR